MLSFFIEMQLFRYACLGTEYWVALLEIMPHFCLIYFYYDFCQIFRFTKYIFLVIKLHNSTSSYALNSLTPFQYCFTHLWDLFKSVISLWDDICFYEGRDHYAFISALPQWLLPYFAKKESIKILVDYKEVEIVCNEEV